MPHVANLMGRTQGRVPEDAPLVGAPVSTAFEARDPTGAAMPAVSADGDSVRPAASRNGIQYNVPADRTGAVVCDVGTENVVAPAAATGQVAAGRATAGLLALGAGDYGVLNFDLFGRLRTVGSMGNLPLTLRSDSAVNFTGAIAPDNAEEENIAGLSDDQVLIESVVLISEVQIGWEVHFWSSDTFSNADPDLDAWLDFVSFSAADGRMIANEQNTLWRYAASGLGIHYRDGDGTQELHVSLVARNGAKAAGAADEVVLLVTYRPQV